MKSGRPTLHTWLYGRDPQPVGRDPKVGHCGGGERRRGFFKGTRGGSKSGSHSEEVENLCSTRSLVQEDEDDEPRAKSDPFAMMNFFFSSI